MWSITLLLLLSRFFLCLWLYVYSVTQSLKSYSLRPDSLESTRLLYPWNFPGKGIVIGYYFLQLLSRGYCWSRDQTHVSCISCIAGRFFMTAPPGKPLWLYTVWLYCVLAWSSLDISLSISLSLLNLSPFHSPDLGNLGPLFLQISSLPLSLALLL